MDYLNFFHDCQQSVQTTLKKTNDLLSASEVHLSEMEDIAEKTSRRLSETQETLCRTDHLIHSI